MKKVESTPPASSLNIGQIYFLLFRHLRLILICCALGVAGAIAVYFFTPTVFRSEAKLMVRYIVDTTVLDPAATGGRTISPTRTGDNIINSEVEVLTSRDLVEQVLDEVGVDRFQHRGSPDTDRLRIIRRILRNLRVDVVTRSNVIRIYYDAPVPALAQDVLQSVVNHYLRKHIEIHRSAGAYDFLSQQTDQIRARLADTEAELSRIKNDASIVSVADAKRSLLTRMEELIREEQEAESALAASDAKMRALHPHMSALTEASGSADSDTNSSAYYARIYEKLARLQDRAAELQVTFTEDSIPVQNIREQIAELEKTLGPFASDGRDLGSTVLSTNMQQSLLDEEAYSASISARIKVLKQQIEETRMEARKLDEIEGRVVLLERNKEIQEANYKYFSQSLERARIDDALDAGKISNIAIVQPATFPAEKLRPNLMLNMALSLALGLVCGLGLAFVHETFVDHSFRRPSQLEPILRMPMLISIPWVDGLGRNRARKPVALLKPHDGPVSPEEVSTATPHIGLHEYHETLRDRLIAALGPKAEGPCVIGVTSCSLGAGVSTTASGLAFTLSCANEGTVLLMDADPGHGTPYSMIYGGSPVAGTTDMSTDRQGNTTMVERNLYHVPAPGKSHGAVAASPSERFQDIVMYAIKSGCRYVVLDLPPVSDTSPTLRVAGLVSALIMVVEAEKDHRDVVCRARDLLRQAGGKVLGAVLNKTRSWVPRWLYPVY